MALLELHSWRNDSSTRLSPTDSPTPLDTAIDHNHLSEVIAQKVTAAIESPFTPQATAVLQELRAQHGLYPLWDMCICCKKDVVVGFFIKHPSGKYFVGVQLDKALPTKKCSSQNGKSASRTSTQHQFLGI